MAHLHSRGQTRALLLCPLSDPPACTRPRACTFPRSISVCLEELSIVFGPPASVLCFFSGLQETWPPCAQEPFGTGQGERKCWWGGGAQCTNVGHFKGWKTTVKDLLWGVEGSIRHRRADLIEVPPSHCSVLCCLALLCCGLKVLKNILMHGRVSSAVQTFVMHSLLLLHWKRGFWVVCTSLINLAVELCCFLTWCKTFYQA